ncbi:hypothetical protein O181_047198 [Austropuccinia psidii MF-1]|uniref:Uncharacterized protein n=1 Tax=Austropuccinia psidii MF-1 TaxID=1389203 RepID=A0A9Q3DTN9_9BASI|nr:hypothetical protein [Austropuccinia psidii MF-1]
MSMPCYSSMHMCICQHCSAQTHSSPEGDRQGVELTPFQYKQLIKKLKSAIAPKYLENIPTSASGSECPQILLDQIFPADYSQLTQSTFSTPPGLNSTAQRPYSRGPNLPPQGLGMIISAIISPGRILRQLSAIDFTSHRASRQRQSSHVSHENVTQSPNPFQHYLQRLGNFT